MAAIRLDFLGGFRAGTPGGMIVPISSKKGRALLAYLALQKRAQMREKLSGLLWSSREQAQAQNSLRHELVELRRAFDDIDPAPLAFDGDTVGFTPDTVDTDVTEFERRIEDDSIEALQAAANLYRGPFLDGLAIRDSVFEEWLARERERLHELAIVLFDRLAARLTGAAAVSAGKALVALDPLREASHRALMCAHATQGDSELALRQYQSCRDVLREELDVAPDSETERLHQAIRGGELNPEAPDAIALTTTEQRKAESGKPLLAVLPFDIVGRDADLEAVGAGLVDEISTGMARFRLVSVASRRIALAYKDQAADMSRLRREIGARYALTGSLRRSGERMRAAIQLTEMETGRQLWSECYDRGLADAFAVQDELTQAIIAGTEHVLVEAEHRRALSSGLGEQKILNQTAGWHLFRFTREDNARAIDLLRQAIAQNPNADRRYQGLALALGIDLAFGWAASSEDTIVEMVGAAERSVSLREGDAWNHAPLSWSLMFARQFERAAASAGRMIELHPNSGVSYGVSAVVLAHCGDPDTALELLGHARRMAPQAPFMFNYLTAGAIAQFRLRRFTEAAELAESAGIRRPNHFQPQLILAAALAGLGERERAAAALAAARRLAPRLGAAWLRPLIPLRHESDFSRLVDGLSRIDRTDASAAATA
jgi:DNA-binding SARP family transcriptional activator